MWQPDGFLLHESPALAAAPQYWHFSIFLSSVQEIRLKRHKFIWGVLGSQIDKHWLMEQMAWTKLVDIAIGFTFPGCVSIWHSRFQLVGYLAIWRQPTMRLVAVRSGDAPSSAADLFCENVIVCIWHERVKPKVLVRNRNRMI